jgi:hypothetical protein
MTSDRIANLIGKTIAVVVGVGLLAAMAAGVYLGGRTIASLFAALDREVASVTAIACGAVLLAAWSIARGIRAASRQNRATTIRDEKSATYQLLLDFWVNRLEQAPRAGELSPELAGKLRALDRLLALYGDVHVIAAHTALRDRVRDHPDEQPRVGDVVVAVRKDLGTDTPHEIARSLDQLLLPHRDGSVALRSAMA